MSWTELLPAAHRRPGRHRRGRLGRRARRRPSARGRPARFLPEVVRAGAAIVTVHAEASRHPHRVLGELTALSAEVRPVIRGFALNPGTPVAVIEPVLDLVDLVLVLAVDPGWPARHPLRTPRAGSPRYARWPARTHPVLVGVDGGVRLATPRRWPAGVPTSSSAAARSSTARTPPATWPPCSRRSARRRLPRPGPSLLPAQEAQHDPAGRPLRVLAIGDPYMPVISFADALASLGEAVTVTEMQIDRTDAEQPRTESERRCASTPATRARSRRRSPGMTSSSFTVPRSVPRRWTCPACGWSAARAVARSTSTSRPPPSAASRWPPRPARTPRRSRS